MARHIADSADTSFSQEIRRKVQTDDPAGLRDRTDHLIGQVARMPGHRPGIGMRRNKGLFAVFLYIPEAIIGQMGHIHKDSQTVHLLHRLDSQRLQPTVLPIGKAKRIFIIPGQRDQPHTQVKDFLHILQIASADAAVLDGKQKPGLFFLKAPFQFLPAAHRQQAVRIPLQHILPDMLYPQKFIHAFLFPGLRRKHPGGYKGRTALHPDTCLFQPLQVYHMGIFFKAFFLWFQHRKRITVKIYYIHPGLPFLHFQTNVFSILAQDTEKNQPNRHQTRWSATVRPAEHSRIYSSAAAWNASSRSSRISSICSVPTESRMVFGWIPCSASSSSVHWLCVVVAG